MKTMKVLKSEWWKNGWVWAAIGCIVLSLILGVLAEVYWLNDGWAKIISIILAGITTFFSFFCGVRAHAKQTKILEEMEPLVKDIYRIVVKSNKVNQIGNVNFTENACAKFVKLTLYAMYHANTNRSKNHIKCNTISKKYPNLIMLIVQSIFVAFKSDDIMGRIGDDGCIVIDVFNKDIPMDCTDARAILKSYEHTTSYDEIKASINRINRACGMNPVR